MEGGTGVVYIFGKKSGKIFRNLSEPFSTGQTQLCEHFINRDNLSQFSGSPQPKLFLAFHSLLIHPNLFSHFPISVFPSYNLVFPLSILALWLQ